jgi:deazaflavin-dependent oxidoreductase (nitroreductase family)
MKTPPNEVMVRRYRAGLGKFAGRMVLLLTTTGRKTGNLHTVAAQYEKIGGKYYIGAGRGQKCDWYRNILANPDVEIEIGATHLHGKAAPILDVEALTDFLVYRLKKHPLMVGMILKSDGCAFRPSRGELLEYCKGIAAVIITPNA